MSKQLSACPHEFFKSLKKDVTILNCYWVESAIDVNVLSVYWAAAVQGPECGRRTGALHGADIIKQPQKDLGCSYAESSAALIKLS